MTFLKLPSVRSIRPTMTMRCKKTSAMFPKPRPDFLGISLWQLDSLQSRSRKKLKCSLTVLRRQSRKPLLHLKQKHQPVTLPLISMLTDQTRQMQLLGLDGNPQFLLRFATRTRIRRFPFFSVQLSPAWTPQPQIRLLRAFHQQNFIALIEAIKQRGNFIRQNRRAHFNDTRAALPTQYNLCPVRIKRSP